MRGETLEWRSPTAQLRDPSHATALQDKCTALGKLARRVDIFHRLIILNRQQLLHGYPMTSPAVLFPLNLRVE